MGDTVALLSDLGRTLRISASFNKKLHILLADRDWTRLNWVVMDYGEHNLTRSENWREALYKSLGCYVKKCNMSNSPHISRTEIENLSSSYTELARSIFGLHHIGHRLTSDEIHLLESNFHLQTGFCA
jgi:hypothetical protein